MKPTLLILAAGIGSRYGGIKQMDKFGPSGESIIDYSIYDAIRAGFGKVVFVISPKIESEFKEFFNKKLNGKIATDYVLQEISNVPEGIEVPKDRVKPWGTGHAVMVAKSKINEPFAVINADDFYGSKSFDSISNYLSNLSSDSTDYCMVGYRLLNTLSDHGFVSRGICTSNKADFLETIVERTHITKDSEGKIEYKEEGKGPISLTGNETASMNLMGFPASFFNHCETYFKDFIKENNQTLKAEFYLPFIVNSLISSGQARMKVLDTPEKWFGVTYKEDKEVAVKKIASLVESKTYPANLWE
ncbi:MAG: nucleotidyltransferase [Flammeovirgaceae bacterium]|nr:nucleotidyltransferase [Flammeovirgaceae bacterium]